MAADANYQTKNYEKQGGAEWVVGGLLTIPAGGIIDDANGQHVRSKRARFTIAQVNAGIELLPAIAGKSYRITDVSAIAVGGAAGAVTTVDVLGTQSASSVKLVTFAQASLTQSTLLFDGGSGSTLLADGASYVANDAGTNITVGKTGSSITTATNIDINIKYTIE